jgi:Protein of unknown function (DUF2851)
MKKLSLNENFISRIWLNPSYYNDIKTTDGRFVNVINYGIPNSDSGADFSDALIKIDDVIYSGDVEIHQSVNDWNVHKHKKDAKYNKVILHVAFWDDDLSGSSLSLSNREIPTVILSKYLTSSVHDIWKDIINNPSPKFKLPCYDSNNEVSTEIKREWIKDVGMSRLVYRAGRISSRKNVLSEDLHITSKKDVWEKIFLEFTFEALGFSKNKTQFLNLSKLIDLKKTKKHVDNIHDTEAILFGTAGFLCETKDEYQTDLIKRWNELQPLLKFDSIDKSEWHFFRLRPLNFPTLRIAYASAFMLEIIKSDFLKRIVFCFKNSNNVFKDLTSLFLELDFADFWKHHYDFGKKSKKENSVIGKSRVTDIIINVVIPLMYLYSKEFSDEVLFIKVKKTYLTTKDKSENNVLDVMIKQLGIKPAYISESQGLIHLHNFYCVKGNCGECKIGEKVFDKFAVNEVLKIILY